MHFRERREKKNVPELTDFIMILADVKVVIPRDIRNDMKLNGTRINKLIQRNMQFSLSTVPIVVSQNCLFVQSSEPRI